MSGGPDYLAQINSALGAPPPPPRVPGPAPAPPLDFMGQIGSTLGAPQPTGQVIDNGAIAQGGFTLAPSPGPLPPPPVPTGPLGPVERAPIGPPSPAPSPEPARPFLQQVGGAGVANVPAKETELRGPHLQVAQQARNTAFEEALHNVNERTQDAVMHERDLAFEQERLAHAREDAANAAAAQRNEEMQQRQADFDQGVKALSQQSIDPNRFWSNTSTGGKIGAFIAIALGGFTSQQNGGRNLGLDQVNKMINDDVRAQEFAFQAQHAAVNAKQTAFSMAMQKYNNVDAARAMARAAALDTAQAQVAQQAALWKGTEAANRAEIAAASLQDEKMQQVAAGIAFMPARQVAVGASYVDPRTGLRYSEQEAKGLVKTIDEHDFEERKQGAGIAGQLLVEGAKVDKTAAKDQRALSVRLPNGDTVVGRDPVQARELSEAATASHEIQRLTAQAKEIRTGEGFRIPGSASRARLEQIQKNLITNYAVMHKLGAISGPDMDLATGGTAKLFDVGPGPEAALDSLNDTAQANIRNIVKTIPDAPGSAKGEMPASFTPHGKK